MIRQLISFFRRTATDSRDTSVPVRLSSFSCGSSNTEAMPSSEIAVWSSSRTSNFCSFTSSFSPALVIDVPGKIRCLRRSSETSWRSNVSSIVVAELPVIDRASTDNTRPALLYRKTSPSDSRCSAICASGSAKFRPARGQRLENQGSGLPSCESASKTIARCFVWQNGWRDPRAS